MKKHFPFEILLLLLILPMISITYLVVQIPAVEREQYSNLESIVLLKAEQIGSWLKERQGDCEAIKGSLNLALRIEKFLQQPDNPVQLNILSNQLDLLRSAYQYESALLVDTQGKLLLGKGSQPDISSVVKSLLPQVMAYKQIVNSDLYREENGDIHMDWLVPVFARAESDGEVIAFLVLRVAPNRFLYKMIQTWPTRSASAETLLVRKEGDAIIYLNELRHLKGTALSMKRPLSSPLLPAAVAVQTDQPGTLQGFNYKGSDVLSAYRPVAGTNWRIVAIIDRAEILAPMWNTFYWIVGIALVAVSGIMAILFNFLRQQRYMQRLEGEAEKAKADEQLRISDFALKAISQGSVITGADRKISWVNEAFEKITGFSNTECLGKSCHFLQGPLTDPLTVEAISLALDNENEFAGEILNYRKDMTTFWNDLTISPVHNAQGQLSHFIGVTRDITERKHNEMLIRNNEQQLLDLLNVSPIAVRITQNQRGKLMFFNPTYDYLFKNFGQMDDNPMNYYAKKEDYQEIIAELSLGNSVLNRQIEFFNPNDDTRFWALTSYMPMLFQGNEATLAWFYDITELMETRKNLSEQLELQLQAKETLRKASAKERAIFDSATSGIVLIKDERIERSNRKLDEIFGYASGELNGKSTRVWYPDQIAYETGVLPVYKEIAEGKFHRLEQQLIRKDGSLFWARLSGKALYQENPAEGLVGIIDDITLEHEATEALFNAKKLAEEMTRTKSAFLANMSHEIRTPMNGVLGMLDLLSETKMTPTQRDWVDTAHSSGEALLEIINDILDLTKLESGKFEVEQADFNLVELVEDVCALLSSRVHAKGLELNCLVPIPMPLRWRGDPMRLRQVLTNLIGNAVKFTEQGEVSVSISQPSVADDLDALRFEIRDTGIGISAEAQELLFKPFSQADSDTSRRFGGSGLGLSISKKLVEMMGGAIGVDSNPGQGSCFWFTLPLTQSKGNQGSAPSYVLSYVLSGKRTLIVDDNATNRKILSTYMGLWGLEVSEVDSGSTALIHLQNSVLQGITYDLVLLDMQMPVMDGLTLTKCLAQIPALANLPIILLSSGDHLEQADYQGTRIVRHLMKPVRQLQLYEAIVNALEGGLAVTPKPERIAIQQPSYQGKKVLVVEDNKINQKVIVAKLRKFDIVPEVAENGQLALDKLAQCAYDLIFMDCHMPIMDGYTATRELRLMETRKGLPHQAVIALTANALEGEREKCLAAGMDDYLTKPIISEQLKAILASRLGKQTAEITPPLSVATALSEQDVWDATAVLDSLDGDGTLLDEMIVLFLSEGPKLLGELAKVQAEGNLPELANVAHAIKGTVVQFYAEQAKACALLLEQTARSGQSADYLGMTDALIKAVEDLINNLGLWKT